MFTLTLLKPRLLSLKCFSTPSPSPTLSIPSATVYAVIPDRFNDQPNTYVRVKFVGVK